MNFYFLKVEASKKVGCNQCEFNSECVVYQNNNSIKCSCHHFNCKNFPRYIILLKKIIIIAKRKFFFQNRNIICGSNGRLYANRCELDHDQCMKQTKIEESPLQSCLGNFSFLSFKLK